MYKPNPLCQHAAAALNNPPIYNTVLAVGMSREILDPEEDPVISSLPSMWSLPLPPDLHTFRHTKSICPFAHTYTRTYIHTYILSMRECIIKLYYTTHTTTRPFIPQINTHPNRLSTPNISQAPLHCTALTGHLTHTLSHTCTCAERIRHAAIRTRYSSGPVHREGALAVGRGGGGGSAGRG